MAKHQCVQFGVCPRADSAGCFEIDSDFRCGREPEDPDCRSKLEEMSGGGARGGLFVKLGIAAALIALIGGGLFFVLRDKPAEPVATAAPPTVESLLKEVWPWLR